MKKNIRNISGMAAVLMAAIIIGSSTVSAYDPPKVTKDLARMPISCSIYPSQAQIGGIRAGIKPKEVRSVLGEPKAIHNDKGIIRYYYDGLILTFIDFGGEERTVLRDIKADRESKFTTSDGVSVGMPEEVLTHVYGMADTVYIEKYTVPKLTEEDNRQYDERMNKTIYTYNVGELLAMHFMVKCGVIFSMQIHLAD